MHRKNALGTPEGYAPEVDCNSGLEGIVEAERQPLAIRLELGKGKFG